MSDDQALPDPRDEPAPMAFVALTVASAAALAVVGQFIEHPLGLKLLLLGPIALVAYEVLVHELWWRRWWGALPGAIAGLVGYYEALAWSEPIAYVLAWALFSLAFALASRVVFPRP